MTKRRRSRRRSSSNRIGNPLIAIVVGLGFLILFVVFIATGSDPIGLFGSGRDEPAPFSTRPALSSGGGDWWQVYFTNPGLLDESSTLDGTVLEPLIGHIEAARDSIHIAAYEFDLPQLAGALADASRRGVEVMWLTDDEHGLEDDEDGLGLFAQLEEAGVEVRDDGRGELMHNKFVIIDGALVWTGSTNLTSNGVFRNNNNALAIESASLARVYEGEFQEMWNGQFGAQAPSSVAQQGLSIQGTPVQVYFAAEDKPISALVPLVQQAQESVRFMAFSFTHDELAQAMLDRAAAGVSVAGVFETRGSETEFSELSRLYCAGLPVRQDGNPGMMHHKVIIIDDRLLVTGSANFSESADRFNDENVIVIDNQDLAQEYVREFERIWAQASDPADLDC